MNIVPQCETSNSEVPSPCETHTAKPCTMRSCTELTDPGMLRTLLHIGAGPQTSLDVSGFVVFMGATCLQCKNSPNSPLQSLPFSFPLPGPNLLPCCCPASSSTAREVKPSHPQPNQCRSMAIESHYFEYLSFSNRSNMLKSYIDMRMNTMNKRSASGSSCLSCLSCSIPSQVAVTAPFMQI